MTPKPEQVCPDCGQPLPADSAIGVCAYCLMGMAREDTSTGINHFGNYEIQERIGQGGGGIVYKARHHRLKRLVALKVMQVGHLATQDEIRRFEREAEAISQLDHDQIVTLFEFGECDGRAFLAMEYMEGGDLARYRKRFFSKGAPTLSLQRDAVTLTAQVARIAHHAHQRGFIHRDIKPGNILLDAENVPHLSDFGLVKWDEAGAMTHSAEEMGTPGYMSPEQALGQSKKATVRSDTYSLGAVFYELLTGRPPFQEASPLATMKAVLEQNPKPPTQIQSQIPRDLEIICLKALEKDPKQRYGSAEEFAVDLEHWLKGEPIQARAIGFWEKSLKWIKRNPVISSLSTAAILFLISGIATTLWQWRRATREEHASRKAYYTTGIPSAIQNSTQGRYNVGRDILDSLKPRRQEEDLRGFEWRLARLLCMGDSHLERQVILPEYEGVSFCIDKDLQWFAMGSSLNEISIFNYTNHTLVRKLSMASTSGLKLNQSADGKYLAAASVGGWQIWEGPNFVPIMSGTNVPFAHTEFLFATLAQFLTDGTFLVCENSKVLKVFPAERKSTVFHTFKSNTATSVAASPQGNRLAIATSAFQGKAYILDVWIPGGVRPELSAQNYSGPITSLEFSPTGNWIAFSGLASPASPTLWNLSTKTEYPQIAKKKQDYLFSAAWSPDESLLALGSVGGEIKVIQISDFQVVKRLYGSGGVIRALLFSSDGSHLCCRTESQFSSWRVNTPAPPDQFHSHVLGNVYYGADLIQINFSDDGKQLWTAAMDYGLRTFDVPSFQQKTNYPIYKPSAISSLMDGTGLPIAFSKTRAASFNQDGELSLYSLPDGRKIPLSAKPSSGINACAMTKDGKQLISGGVNGAILHWNLTQTNTPFMLGQFANLIPTKILLKEEQNLIVVGLMHTAVGGELVAWQGPERRMIKAVTNDSIMCLDISPDGRHVVFGNFTGHLKILETQKWSTIATISAHNGPVTSVKWSKDGRTIASGSSDKAVVLTSASNGSVITTLFRGTHPIADIDFAPEDQYLAVATTDHQVRLWHAPTYDELNRLEARVFGP